MKKLLSLLTLCIFIFVQTNAQERIITLTADYSAFTPWDGTVDLTKMTVTGSRLFTSTRVVVPNGRILFADALPTGGLTAKLDIAGRFEATTAMDNPASTLTTTVMSGGSFTARGQFNGLALTVQNGATSGFFGTSAKVNGVVNFNVEAGGDMNISLGATIGSVATRRAVISNSGTLAMNRPTLDAAIALNNNGGTMSLNYITANKALTKTISAGTMKSLGGTFKEAVTVNANAGAMEIDGGVFEKAMNMNATAATIDLKGSTEFRGVNAWDIEPASTLKTLAGANARFIGRTTMDLKGAASLAGNLRLEERTSSVQIQIGASMSILAGAEIQVGNAIKTGPRTLNGPLVLDESALPIQLISFDANLIELENKVLVSWTVALEEEVDRYEIIRGNGFDQEVVHTIENIGSSNEFKAYNFDDLKIGELKGQVYYQLISYDIDGSTQSSEIVAIDFTDYTAVKVSVYPNPAIDHLNIKSEAAGVANIMDINGRLVKQINHNAGVERVSVNDMPAGTYFIKYNNSTIADKVVVQD